MAIRQSMKKKVVTQKRVRKKKTKPLVLIGSTVRTALRYQRAKAKSQIRECMNPKTSDSLRAEQLGQFVEAIDKTLLTGKFNEGSKKAVQKQIDELDERREWAHKLLDELNRSGKREQLETAYAAWNKKRNGKGTRPEFAKYLKRISYKLPFKSKVLERD